MIAKNNAMTNRPPPRRLPGGRVSTCRRQCAPIRPRAVVPATASTLRNNRPIQRKVHPGDSPSIAPRSFQAAERTICLHHNHGRDKLAQRASVKALATGVINQRSKYRQEERREGGWLQFQDKQSSAWPPAAIICTIVNRHPAQNLTKMCASRSMTRAAARGQKPTPSIVPASVP
jgi:hypothetical protein